MKKPVLKALLAALVTTAVVGSVLFYFSEQKRNHGPITLYGNVDVREVDIGFRVSGQVTNLFFEEGDYVAKGTLLATLDKTPYNSQVRQAAAHVASVKAALVNAEKLLKRRQELIGAGGVSQEDLDDSMAHRDELVADLAEAEAALVVAKDNLAYTEAYAPIDGFILTRIREPGTVALPSAPVYTLSVARPVWIRAYVNEPQLGNVYYGMKAEVTTDTKGARTYEGRVGFISPVAEFTPKTVETTDLRTDLVYRLRIYIDQPDDLLKQGMPVTVQLQRKPLP